MRPQLETLEARVLPACGTAAVVHSLFGDVAIIQGTPGDDHLGIRQAQDGTYVADVNGVKTSLTGNIRYVYFTGGAGNDHIRNDTGLDSLIHGGAGNDHIRGGSGVDVIYGDEGEDHIRADPTADVVVDDPEYPGQVTVDGLGSLLIFYGTEGDDRFVIGPTGEGGTETYSVYHNAIEQFIVPSYFDTVIDITGAGRDAVVRVVDGPRVIVLDDCAGDAP